jgi:hypothetical protein
MRRFRYCGGWPSDVCQGYSVSPGNVWLKPGVCKRNQRAYLLSAPGFSPYRSGQDHADRSLRPLPVSPRLLKLTRTGACRTTTEDNGCAQENSVFLRLEASGHAFSRAYSRADQSAIGYFPATSSCVNRPLICRQIRSLFTFCSSSGNSFSAKFW